MKKEHPRANEWRAKQQSRHIDETVDLDRKLDRRINRKEIELNEYYGPFIEQSDERIDQLNQKLDQKGVKGWAYHFFHGNEAKNEIDQIASSKSDALARKDEAMQSVKNAALEEKIHLQSQHWNETNHIEYAITNKAVPIVREAISNDQIAENLPGVEVKNDYSIGHLRGRSR